MTTVGQREILTQQRMLSFFRDTLGYAYLGPWKDAALHHDPLPDHRGITSEYPMQMKSGCSSSSRYWTSNTCRRPNQLALLHEC